MNNMNMDPLSNKLIPIKTINCLRKILKMLHNNKTMVRIMILSLINWKICEFDGESFSK